MWLPKFKCAAAVAKCISYCSDPNAVDCISCVHYAHSVCEDSLQQTQKQGILHFYSYQLVCRICEYNYVDITSTMHACDIFHGARRPLLK